MIYLDHAATSYPKPPGVLAAITDWYANLGVSADRGDSQRTQVVRQRVATCRAALGRLLGLPAARVAFTSGATEALNLALRAMLRPEDTVLTTVFEHAAVVRPLLALAAERRLRIEVVGATADGDLDLERALTSLADRRPALFVFGHASNVTGARFDAAALVAAARHHGVRTMLDASQTVGLFDVAVGADVIVGSAHKSLLGPPGLGFLGVRDGLELPTQKQGGTGNSRALAVMPAEWPAAFEPGTPNTPAILGLGAALDHLAAVGLATQRELALARAAELRHGLAALPGIRLLPTPAQRTPVVSFVPRDLDVAELGALFDAAGIHVRTGFHCAPWVHEAFGTAATGTVRLSPGASTSAADVQAALAVVAG